MKIFLLHMLFLGVENTLEKKEVLQESTAHTTPTHRQKSK